jgi:hypothetical protein
MADSTEVVGGPPQPSAGVPWIAGYAAALEDVDRQAKRDGMGVIVEWVAQPMATARLAWRRRINGGAS